MHDYRFEVASIRPAEAPNGRNSGLPGPPAPDRFTDKQTTIAVLAYKAFGVKHHFEIKYQPWMASTYFTVNATFPQGATRADLPIMIQHLLEDRFGLVFHHETHPMSGYQLVVAKSGPRLVKSAPPAADEPRFRGPSIEVKNGVPQFTKDAASGELLTLKAATWHGRNETLKRMVANLADLLETPVTDATGLDGAYEYDLTFTPEARSASGTAASPVGGTPMTSMPSEDAPLEHPLLREALEEQLGLKLQSAGNVPVDVVVLDSAHKVPTEN